MEVSALLAEYRRRADDRAGKKHTSDEEAIRFAAEAEREAAIRARLLRDSETDGVAVYTASEGGSIVQLSKLVFLIDAATFQPASGGRARPLYLSGMDEIRTYCDWETRSETFVQAIAQIDRYNVRLFPSARAGGTLRLSVYRLPLAPLEGIYDEPEIAEEHHDGLVDWMLYRTWSAKDSEQEDPRRAAQALADFTERFGERPTAGQMRMLQERRRTTTRYGGM